MVKIVLENVIADFPIFNAGSRSFKKSIFDIATGGQVFSNQTSYPTVRALDSMTLKIIEGEKVGLIGHNGAGKSTLLRLLNGIYEPTAGKADIVGTRQSLLDINSGIDPEATGRQNIHIYSAIKDIPKRDVIHNLENIIEFSELGDFIDLPVRTYSSGMQLRLAFAISTFWRSDILLMDEWISVGDDRFAKKAEKKLRELVDTSKILVIASHSVQFLRATCNRIIWLEHGKCKLDGKPEYVLDEYSLAMSHKL